MKKLLSKSATRTLLKALSYRTVSLLTTACVGYCLTGSLSAALSFGAVDAVFKMGVYAAHEKAWERLTEKGEEATETAAAPAAA